MNRINTVDWIGYAEAIPADSEQIKSVQRFEDGNLYVLDVFGNAFNVHPKVTACGWEDHGHKRIERPGGVYPVRWQLDGWELDQIEFYPGREYPV